jgi:hypothetical protein
MNKFFLVNSEEPFYKELVCYLKNTTDNANVYIILISEWDIVNKKDLINDLILYVPIGNIHFLDVPIDQNVTYSDFENLDLISKSLPFVYNFQDLLLCSQHYHSQYHGRIGEDPNVDFDKTRAIAIIKYIQNLILQYNIEFLFTFDKSGWERRLIIAIFLKNNINVITTVSSMHGNMYFWERLVTDKILYLDINNNPIIEINLIENTVKRGTNYEKLFPEMFNKSENIDLIAQRRREEIKSKEIVIKINSVIIKFFKLQFKNLKILFWFFKWRLINIKNKQLQYFGFNGNKSFTVLKFTKLLLDKLILFYRANNNYLKYIFNLFINKNYYEDTTVVKRLKSTLNNKSYSLIALHYFPESSTLGEHGVFQNEFQNFRFIQTLNKDNNQYVFVDHPQMFFTGERNSWGKRFFQKIPNSLYYDLMSPTGIPYEVIKGSSHVFTITGTIALEAALLGKEVTIFNLHPSIWINNIRIGYIPNSILIRDLNNPFNSASNYQTIARNFGIQKTNLLKYLLNGN